MAVGVWSDAGFKDGIATVAAVVRYPDGLGGMADERYARTVCAADSNSAELQAVLLGVRHLPAGNHGPITVCTDSAAALEALAGNSRRRDYLEIASEIHAALGGRRAIFRRAGRSQRFIEACHIMAKAARADRG